MPRRKKRTTKRGHIASGAAGYVAGGASYGAGVGAKINIKARKKAVKKRYKTLISNPETKKYLKDNPGARSAALRKRIKTKARAVSHKSEARKMVIKTLGKKSFKKKAAVANILGAAAGVALYRRSKNKKKRR